VETGGGGSAGGGDVVTAAQRDTAVTHLRFLNIFCNLRHDTLAHAVQLLDLVLGRVKVTTEIVALMNFVSRERIIVVIKLRWQTRQTENYTGQHMRNTR